MRAEWIKFKSVSSPYWLLGIALLLSLGIAALMGNFLDDMMVPGMTPVDTLMGPMFTQLPLLLIWIVAIVANTGEYRQGTIRSAFAFRPHRWDVYLAKTLFYVLVTVVSSAVVIFCAYLLAYAVSGNDDVAPWSGDVLSAGGKVLVYAAVGTLLVTGLSFLLRNAAGTITLVVAWTAVLEGIVNIIPKVGEKIYKWMPFHNGLEWATPMGYGEKLDDPWNILWFLVIALAFWAGGLALMLRRDA